VCVNQVYLLDSTGSRAWVDHEGCKEFVSNVLTAFPDSVLVSDLVRICKWYRLLYIDKGFIVCACSKTSDKFSLIKFVLL